MSDSEGDGDEPKRDINEVREEVKQMIKDKNLDGAVQKLNKCKVDLESELT